MFFKRITVLILLLMCGQIFAVNSFEGYWKTIDESSRQVTGIIAVYEFEKKMYGRIVVQYDQKNGTLIDTMYEPTVYIDGNEGYSKVCDSNLFWNLEPKGSEWEKGTLIDPRDGNTFKCKLLKRSYTIILKGIVGIFSGKQVLYPAKNRDFPDGFIIPDINSFTPVIPVY